jgi:ABC-type uncharacterized transport system permease subunit
MEELFFTLKQHAGLMASLIALLYCGLAVLGWQRNRGLLAAVSPSFETKVLWCVAVLHTVLLLLTLSNWQTNWMLNLGFAQALSLAACVGVWLFIIESRWVAIQGLLPLVLSLPIVAVPLAVWVPPTLVHLQGWAAVHVLIAIAAHGVALLACGHAVLLLALNRVLKNGATTGWALALAQHCPPLVVLERLLIRLSVWMVVLLLLTVVFGWLGALIKWDHKTVLTLASLIAWFIVPIAYHRRGWRSAQLFAAVMTATGLLLLAYIGSRFVLQALLNR